MACMARRCWAMRRRRASRTACHRPNNVPSESRWIGLNNPNMRISQIKRDERAVTAISPTQTRPISLWRASPLRRQRTVAPSTSAAMAATAWIWMIGLACSSGSRDMVILLFRG